MRNNIIEAGDLPEKEKVYLKKDLAGYRIVYPLKNEDGTYNWLNILFGGKRGILKIILLILFFTILFFGVSQITSECSNLAKNPCDFCYANMQNNFVQDNFISGSWMVNLDGS